MKLKDVDFEKLDTIRVKCLGFAQDGNSVINRWRDLYPLESVTGDRDVAGFGLEVVKRREAERCIRAKERLQNIELEEGRSIVLHLMKKYHINVPLKTQGWINKKLASVVFEDDGVNLRYYREKGCKCSESIYHYLDLLKSAVDAAV